MSRVDPTARVADGANIGADVSIGPYCIVSAGVTLSAGCKLVGHVNVDGQTTIGAGTVVYPFASLGTAPQSLGHRGEPTTLTIGENCTIRESVTINTGTVSGGGITRIGDRCYLMAYSHVGHDCRVGDDVIFANSATLAGHCDVGDYTYIGGLAAVHQFTRIGQQAMIGGLSGVNGDVIPFGTVVGERAVLEGLNVVGMQRRNFTRQRLHVVRAFYQRLFHGPGTFAERLQILQAEPAADPAIEDIITFITAERRRPLCFPRAASGG